MHYFEWSSYILMVLSPRCHCFEKVTSPIHHDSLINSFRGFENNDPQFQWKFTLRMNSVQLKYRTHKFHLDLWSMSNYWTKVIREVPNEYKTRVIAVTGWFFSRNQYARKSLLNGVTDFVRSRKLIRVQLNELQKIKLYYLIANSLY